METKIIICQGSSCFARGNKENLLVIQNFLKENQLEANVSFKGQLCTEKCTQGPIIIINGQTYTDVNEKTTTAILNEHFKR